MGKFVDLHTHSTASDGTLSPRELVRLAAGSGLGAIAFTDHDTTDGLAEGQEAADDFGIEFVRGCELSARYNQYSVHIIGLFLPHDLTKYPALMTTLGEARESRNKRNLGIIKKMQALGMDVDITDVEALAGGDIIGRPHFARLLVQRGFVHNEQEAFREYLVKGKKIYVPRECISPHEGVEVLKKAGAVTVLAHPALIPCTTKELETLVEELIPCGLDAVEAYHSAHSDKETRAIVKIASKYNLLLSGGSDFHGAHKANVKLGRGKGGLRVPYLVLEKLKDLHDSRAEY